MKLKFLFFFLALLLTAVWTILLVLTLKERGALFYIGEGVITFSLNNKIIYQLIHRL